MTRDRARKKAIRARMAASGEPYNVAARKTADTPPAAGPVAVGEVIACAARTLAAPSARIEFRVDNDIVLPERHEQRRPGPMGKLARLAARTAWERIGPRLELDRLREAFTHPTGEGFLEPAAGRYLIDYGGYAEMCLDGTFFAGPSGGALRPRSPGRRAPGPLEDPLGMLRQLRDVTGARSAGGETLRGTPCRTVAVTAGTAELTVWIDDHHVRRIQVEERASDTVSKRRTLDLWDIGVPAGPLDWSRLPSFRSAG